MVDTYTKAKVIARIVFSDNSEITVTTKEVGVEAVNNFIYSGEISESLSASSNNPIGVPCATEGSLVIKTLDQSLMPENTNSPYFGLMDNEAVIYLSLEDSETEGTPLSLGVFYVDNWYSTVRHDSTNTVTLEFTGIMSQLNKASIPTLNIEKNVSFKSYLIGLIDKWNESADDKHKIIINEDKLTFGDFDIMPYSDIEAETIGEALTIISQSTLTNLYITGENELLTDYCFDDTASEAVSVVDDCANAVSYSLGEALLVKYKGVKVNYNNIIVNSPTTISSISGQTILAGEETEINNINTGGKLFKLNYVKINCEVDDVVDVVDLSYSKKEANIKLANSHTEDVSVDIELVGQTINANSMNFTIGSEPILEVTNSLVDRQGAKTFMTNLNKVIHNRGNQISVSGYFNPRVNLGSVVNVKLKAIKKEGVYKVYSRAINIGAVLKTSLTLYPLIESN